MMRASAGSSPPKAGRINLVEYLPYLVNRVGAALAARFTEDALARHGLSIAMWRVLAALSHAGSQRQVDLSDVTSIEVSTLSRLVTRLVHMGLVTRLRSTSSNREVRIQLTVKGQKLVDRLVSTARHWEQVAVADLSPSDLQTLKRCLRRMYSNLIA